MLISLSPGLLEGLGPDPASKTAGTGRHLVKGVKMMIMMMIMMMMRKRRKIRMFRRSRRMTRRRGGGGGKQVR